LFENKNVVFILPTPNYPHKFKIVLHKDVMIHDLSRMSISYLLCGALIAATLVCICVYAKNCAHVFLIFFNCYCKNIYGALYSIFKFFGRTNKTLLIFIEKKNIKHLVMRYSKTNYYVCESPRTIWSSVQKGFIQQIP